MLKYQTLMQHNHISSHSRALLRDMECFPVRKDRRGKVSWDFEDGYGAPRTFGGKRSHEGVDIMYIMRIYSNMHLICAKAAK